MERKKPLEDMVILDTTIDLIIRNAKLRNVDDMMDIGIQNGKIVKIEKKIYEAFKNELNAHGKLVIPSFVEPHMHLDKANTIDSVRTNNSGTLKKAIEIAVDRKRTYTVGDILERASKVVEMCIQNGTLTIRTHVDVGTIAGLKPLKGILAVKKKYNSIVDIQIVAFPQEGIIKDHGCEELMWEAVELGADIVGGIPASEDSPDDSKKHVEIAFKIAKAFNCDIDMHIDETDDPFYRTLEMIADATIKNNFQGRVTASHTCALSAYDDHYARYVVEKVKKANLNIITLPTTNLILQGRLDKQPIRRGITRVKELLDNGINLSFGQDNFRDTFYPFGSADLLQVALISAHAAQLTLPNEIEKVFDMITYNAAKILGIENYGINVGNNANLVILNCGNIIDAIRLQPERSFVIKNGKVIFSETRLKKFTLALN